MKYFSENILWSPAYDAQELAYDALWLLFRSQQTNKC